MTAREVLARMLGGYGHSDEVPSYDYITPDAILHALATAGFSVVPSCSTTPEPRNTGPGWEPHNPTIKLPRSVTHPMPRDRQN